MTELYIRTGNELIAIQDLHYYFMNNVRSNFTILATLIGLIYSDKICISIHQTPPPRMLRFEPRWGGEGGGVRTLISL